MYEEVSQTVSQDQELQRRIKEGDGSAFSELYSRYKQSLYTYCTLFVGRSAEADDIFQEVFLSTLEKIRSGQEILQIEGYLFRNARNRCYNILRDAKYTRDVYEMEASLPDLGDNISEIQERLRAAVQELPDELREPLVLCDYQGYSYEEISVITDVPVSTLRKRLFRARNKLRTMLNPGNNRQ